MSDEFGPRPPLSLDGARSLLTGASVAVLVEGWSDQAALEALARRRGRDLATERIAVVPIGGIMNIGHFGEAVGPNGMGLRLAGLCDAPEEKHLRRNWARLGLPEASTRAEVEALGFFVCDADLEDELIRAVGAAGVERILEAEGELDSFRRFQMQPPHRERPLQAQLRRFMGTRARRKIRYGTLLVDALELDHVPRALDAVLCFASTA